MTRIFHPLLAMIASATSNELAKYIEFLKEENKILRSRVTGQIHTTQAERETLLKFGQGFGTAIEELQR